VISKPRRFKNLRGLKHKPSSINPTAAKILFVRSNPEYPVMLRYEATVNDGKDALFFSMTEVKKDCSEWRDCSSRKVLNIHFQNLIRYLRTYKLNNPY